MMRDACMGAQSHTSPDLSHKPCTVLQYFSSNPDELVYQDLHGAPLPEGQR